MKLALSWLEEYFIDKPNWELIFNKLTSAGIEVEGVEPVLSYSNIEDRVVELKITPNRGDCLSVVGLLREISSLTGCTYKYNDEFNLKSTTEDKLKVSVDVADACPNYVGVIIKNINNKGTLPDFILKRILRSGHRGISPLVDIVNYVMLELGQPLHTFDQEKVGECLRVRFANLGETLKLLDGTDAILTDNTLIICGESNTPVAIAGVMGGFDSGVTIDTTSIILESAFFTPDVIAGKSKQYLVNSDAAYRFERGVDTKIQDKALRYAAQLINKYLGGEIGQIVSVSHINESKRQSIAVKFSEFERLIGLKLSDEVISRILITLGFEIVAQDKDMLEVTPPSFRFDIKIKEDIIEEVARVYGYDNIPSTLPVVPYTMNKINSLQTRINKLKSMLVSRGFNEVISYAFIEDYYAQIFQITTANVVRLKNPIAGLSVMRSTLLPGLVRTMQNSINRGVDSLKLFELARVFYAEDEDSQPLKLAGLMYGKRNKINWNNESGEVDFYDLKAEVEILLNNVREIKFTPSVDYQFLHSGRCAKIYSCGKEIGFIGQLHPLVGQSLSLDLLPYMFELDVSTLIEHSTTFSFQAISKFQKVTRDLAFIADEHLNIGVMVDYIKSCSIEYLKDVTIFDIYRGVNLGHDKKSIAIKLTFQAEKTLTDEEIEASVSQIIKSNVEQFNVKLRD